LAKEIGQWKSLIYKHQNDWLEMKRVEGLQSGLWGRQGPQMDEANQSQTDQAQGRDKNYETQAPEVSHMRLNTALELSTIPAGG
jgi:hypothetical protein